MKGEKPNLKLQRWFQIKIVTPPLTYPPPLNLSGENR